MIELVGNNLVMVLKVLNSVGGAAIVNKHVSFQSVSLVYGVLSACICMARFTFSMMMRRCGSEGHV